MPWKSSQLHAVSGGLQRSEKALSLEVGTLSLGTLEQRLGTRPDVSVLYGALIVAAAGVLVLVIGNIYALAACKGQVGWGVPGVIVGGLVTLSFFLVAINNSQTTMGISLGICLLGATLTALSIVNLYRISGHCKKSRVAQKGWLVLPWLQAVAGDLQGGLAVAGRF